MLDNWATLDKLEAQGPVLPGATNSIWLE